jgi:hypothetical protein
VLDALIIAVKAGAAGLTLYLVIIVGIATRRVWRSRRGRGTAEKVRTKEHVRAVLRRPNGKMEVIER